MNLSAATAAFLERTSGFDGFWCVAGGWAIDLFLGHQTRDHEDFEIIVLRRDIELVYDHFHQYGPRKILNGGENPFLETWCGELLDPDVIQIRIDSVSDMDFDLLLSPAAGNQWICRRNENVTRPLREIFGRTREGVPFLMPEIVLLFKAKYMREKDKTDFASVMDSMNHEARIWLRENLMTIHPEHEWFDLLGD